jgi:uncharacterized membrane protein YkvA (DUF1232 family)
MANQVKRKLDGLIGLLNLHHTARLFLALMADRRVSWWLKTCAWCGLIYIFSPLDVVPDFITGIGLLDDIIVALLIMQAFLELAPREVVDEHCVRLHIDPRRLFVDVPRTVQDAMELYEIAQNWRGRGGQRRYEPPEAPAAAAPSAYSAAQPPADPTAPAAPYSRYSAFRKG